MKNTIFEPTLDKNCGKCCWSTRDPTNLDINCQLGKTIENTWETAHNCNQYSDIKITRRKKPIQLDLFNQ